MKFKVAAQLSYEVKTQASIILNVHALRTPAQAIIEESFIIDPYIKSEEMATIGFDHRLIRFEATGPVQLNINYSALVDNAFAFIDHTNTKETPINLLDSAILPYLYPSRYCQSDKLYRLARNMFGQIENAFQKVSAIADWIHNNVEYLSGSTNEQTSAFDTVTERAGVCRDFAHLGIALCRALDIPARYFTGYAYLLDPPDFHACFEAYIGGNWILFDPTRLVPINGLVRIATGRDAADASIANLFGDVLFQNLQVSCDLADNFTPYYYEPGSLQGISYL